MRAHGVVEPGPRLGRPRPVRDGPAGAERARDDHRALLRDELRSDRHEPLAVDHVRRDVHAIRVGGHSSTVGCTSRPSSTASWAPSSAYTATSTSSIVDEPRA